MLKDLSSGDKVYLLRKALYGMRQAGRSWHEKLSEVLVEYGLMRSQADPCVFHIGHGAEILVAVIYVDDIIIASRNDTEINKLKHYLSRIFEVKDLGKLEYCLGIQFKRNENGIFLNQIGYINDLLHRFGMSEAKGATTPMEANTKLKKNEDQVDEENLDVPYRELVGGLLYLSICTRLDIAHIASYLGQFNHCHDTSHWAAAKRVLRYLKATKSAGLFFRKTDCPLVGYVDADWGNCPNDRKSYTGYALILAGSAISWESRKQKTVALSSTEAEYMALGESTKEAIYMRRFLLELGFDALETVKIHCDNNGARKLAENPIFHGRTKHIDVHHHFVREAVELGLLEIKYAASSEMAADILTKGLPGPKHRVCMELLGMTSPEVDEMK